MSDEKTTIYISPEEHLTSIGERLGLTPAHYIILVIPTDTLLSNLAAWKRLRVYVDELGKEVQIVSVSAQVRSFAWNVNFKVSSSLEEASPTSKSRPPINKVRPRSSRVGRQSPPSHIKPGQGFDSDDDLPSLQEPPRAYTVRPRHSRISRQPSPSPSARSGQGFDSDDDLPSLQDSLTQSFNIEDEGDQGDFVTHSKWREPIIEDEEDRVGPSRTYNIRPRNRRVGIQSSPPSQLPPARSIQSFDDDDDLPSLQDQPRQITPQSNYLAEKPDLWSEDFIQAPPIREAASISFPESQAEATLMQKGNELSYPVVEETTLQPSIEMESDPVIPYETSDAEENDNVIISTSQDDVPVLAPLKAVKIFYCYAQEDKLLRDELAKHLHPLIRKGYITEWFDREIQAGMDWQQEIKTQLDAADVILLLVSADFISSDYCYGIEMERALERHKAKQAHVIPVILRPTHWEETPLSEIQVLPTGALPITRWPDRDDAFHDIVREIRKVVRQLLSLEA